MDNDEELARTNSSFNQKIETNTFPFLSYEESLQYQNQNILPQAFSLNILVSEG